MAAPVPLVRPVKPIAHPTRPKAERIWLASITWPPGVCPRRAPFSHSPKDLEEYLEDVRRFERLAAAENDPAAQRALERQAEASYKLAVSRAKALHLPEPPKPEL